MLLQPQVANFFVRRRIRCRRRQRSSLSLDALTFTAELANPADSGKVSLARSDKKGANGISLGGVASTATAAGVNADPTGPTDIGHQAIPIRVKATDAGGLSTSTLIYVNVDAHPIVVDQIGDIVFDRSDEGDNAMGYPSRGCGRTSKIRIAPQNLQSP